MVASEKSVGEVFGELRELLVAYARQEVVGPFNRLKHYLLLGIPGALSLSLGLFLISMGILRGLQHISWTSTGFGSLVPFLAMGVFQLAVVFICYRKIRSSMAGGGVGASGSTLTAREPGEVVHVSAEPVAPAPGKITRDDIEAKFSELQGDIEVIGEQALKPLIVAGAVVVTGAVVLAFWLGRRRGRRRRTVVEIRRV